MEQRLTEAAHAGDINGLYALIRENTYVLEHIDEISFHDTPLHTAAEEGQTHFAVEIMSLRPSLGKKLNPDGVSAIHLAILKGHTETVKRLISINSELIRVRGKDGVTPLHCAAELENVDLLAEFLCACPESIEDLNIRCESAIHVVVRNRKFGALDLILGWLQRTRREEVLNWKDENGNTVLHIAVSTSQPQVVRLLVHKVNKNAKNLDGLTALDIARDEDNTDILNILCRARASGGLSAPNLGSLAEFLASREEFGDKLHRYVAQLRMGLSVEMRNVVLVVAVLIATATYQAVLNPPGGVLQVDIATTTVGRLLAGKSVMGGGLFDTFMLMNSIAFTASIVVIFVVLQIRPYSLLLHLSLFFLLCSYSISVQVIAPPSSSFGYSFIIHAFLLFFCGFLCRYGFNVIERGISLFKGKNHALHHSQMRRHVVGW